MTQIKDEISKIQYIENFLLIHAIYLGWIPWIFKILQNCEKGLFELKNDFLMIFYPMIFLIFLQIEISKIQNTQNFHDSPSLTQ